MIRLDDFDSIRHSSYERTQRKIFAAEGLLADGYSCNGNTHWTVDLCRQWWKEKSHLIEQLNHPEVKKVNGGREALYVDYLNSDAEMDLKRYCYFLETGAFPSKPDSRLPDL